MNKPLMIFDAYGTLFNTGKGSVDATRLILQSKGSKIDPAVFYSDWKKIHKRIITTNHRFLPESDIFKKGLEELYATFNIIGDAYKDVEIMLQTLGKRSAYPDVPEIIPFLKNRFKVIIGSNSDLAPLMKDIERSEILFDDVICSESIRAYKPDEDFYSCIKEEYPNHTFNEMIFVGDSAEEDIIIPKKLGMKTVWMNRKKLEWKDPTVSPDYIFTDLFELKEELGI